MLNEKMNLFGWKNVFFKLSLYKLLFRAWKGEIDGHVSETDGHLLFGMDTRYQCFETDNHLFRNTPFHYYDNCNIL